jgi:hypothetical protein
MAFFRLLIIITLFIGCKSQKNGAYVKAKYEHDKRMELLNVAPEPYYNKVADSMKKWVPIFKNVYINDQKNRLVGYGFTKDGWKEQLLLDSQNLKIVTSYLDTYGWPAAFDVGFIGQRAIGMAIQHSPLIIQEKYYPLLVNAYKRDSLLFETVALLEDRINKRNRRFQFYGTQLVSYKGKQVLYPVFNIDSLEIWRKRIGFKITIVDYMKLLNTNWNIDDYKLMLPNLVNEFKVSDTLGIHFSPAEHTY